MLLRESTDTAAIGATTAPELTASPRWSRRRWLIVGLVVALVISAAVGWWLLRSGGEDEARSITTTASVGEVSRTVSASGTLEPADDETLSFEVSGTVTRVLVKLGDTVTEGQALARVGTTLLNSQVTAAEASLDAAQDQLDDASTSTETAAAQAQLTSAQDDLTAAREAVAGAVLRAPFDGQVVALDLEVGDVVGTGSGSSTSTSGTTAMPGGQSSSTSTSTDTAGTIEVASTDRFVVDTTVGSSDLADVKKGLQAQITATDVDETLYGTVTEVGRVATTTSSGGAAFPVTVELTGDVKDVYGGTSASVDIIVEQRSDVLRVPTRAVRSDDDQTYVTVITDGTTSRRTIEIGETYGEYTEVKSGLEDGDTIQLASLPSGGNMPRGGNGEMPSSPDGGQMPGGQMPGGFPGGGFPGGGQ